MVDIWFIYFSKFFRFVESVFFELLLLPQLSANEILAHAKTFGYRLFERVHLKAYIPRWILNPIVDLCAYPMAIWYYFNIQVPLSIFLFIRRHVKLIFDILFRRSVYLRQLFMHASALRRVLHSIWRVIIDTKLSDIVAWCGQALLDILYEYLVSRRSGGAADEEGMSSTLSYDELAELLDYTECEDTRSEQELSEQNRRIKKLMHNPFPVKPFRATVRLPTPSQGPSRATSAGGAGGLTTCSVGSAGSKGVTSEMIADQIGSIASEYIGSRLGDNAPAFVRARLKQQASSSTSPKPRRKTRLRSCSSISSAGVGPGIRRYSTADGGSTPGIDVDQYVSPASYPTTPFSRSRVMNTTQQRVDSTMFNVRDMLRLEELAVSGDRICRQAAERARDTGLIAVFDDSVHASEGIALCCGNHCAIKVGKGTCSSCRSSVPILRNCWVYVEFSITVSGSQVPWLAVGLVSTDAPLNVTVGSWQASAGMNSDGQLLIGSRWFQALDSMTMLLPGTTVGMLIYVESEHELRLQQQELDAHLQAQMELERELEMEIGHESAYHQQENSRANTGFSSLILGGEVSSPGLRRARDSQDDFAEQGVDIEDEGGWSSCDRLTAGAGTEEEEEEEELRAINVSQQERSRDFSGVPARSSVSRTRNRPPSINLNSSTGASGARRLTPLDRLVLTLKKRALYVVELVFRVLMWLFDWAECVEMLLKAWVLVPLLLIDLEVQIAASCRARLLAVKSVLVGPGGLGLRSTSAKFGTMGEGHSSSSRMVPSGSNNTSLTTATLLKNNSSVRRAISRGELDGEPNVSGSDDSWLVGGSPGNSGHSGHALAQMLGGGGSGSSESNNQLSALAVACATPLSSHARIQLKFNINGRLKSFKGIRESQTALEGTGLADREEVYPCVSILSENTRVWNRFCEADVVYKQRSQIGAPSGVKVYCLDGSLLLSEEDE